MKTYMFDRCIVFASIIQCSTNDPLRLSYFTAAWVPRARKTWPNLTINAYKSWSFGFYILHNTRRAQYTGHCMSITHHGVHTPLHTFH